MRSSLRIRSRKIVATVSGLLQRQRLSGNGRIDTQTATRARRIERVRKLHDPANGEYDTAACEPERGCRPARCPGGNQPTTSMMPSGCQHRHARIFARLRNLLLLPGRSYLAPLPQRVLKNCREFRVGAVALRRFGFVPALIKAKLNET